MGNLRCWHVEITASKPSPRYPGLKNRKRTVPEIQIQSLRATDLPPKSTWGAFLQGSEEQNIKKEKLDSSEIFTEEKDSKDRCTCQTLFPDPTAQHQKIPSSSHVSINTHKLPKWNLKESLTDTKNIAQIFLKNLTFPPFSLLGQPDQLAFFSQFLKLVCRFGSFARSVDERNDCIEIEEVANV